MTSHVTALELLWSKLTDVGEQIMETQVISKILSTLPPSYRHFYTTWNNSPEEGRTVKLLLAKLQEEEAISQAFNKKEDDNVLSQSGAYTNFQDYNQLSQSRGFTGAHFPYPQARYQPYFSARGTRRGGYPGLRGGTRGFRGMYRGRGGTSSQQLCSYCGLGPHKASNCRSRLRQEAEKQQCNASFPHRFQTQDQGYSYMLSTKSDFEMYGFVADSGASEHMTDKRSILINFKPIKEGTHTVLGIGNIRLQAEGKGDVEITNAAGVSLLLQDVLYVPGLGINLFSISAATEKGVKAVFSDNMVTFYRNDNLEITGQRANEKLYYLDITVKTQVTSHAATSFTLSTWHQRLAHTNTKTILKMARDLAVSGLDISSSSSQPPLCTGCILGKMHKLPFPSGRKRGSCIGDLIHSDVCGPMQTESPNKSRYFVLFKDDFSGWVEVYFLQHKSEVPAQFKKFVAVFKNQLNCCVRTL